MDDGIRFLDAGAIWLPRVFVVAEVEMGRERVEGLPAIREVGFEGVDLRVVERDEVDVEHLVPTGEEVGYTMAASCGLGQGKSLVLDGAGGMRQTFARAARKDYALGCRRCRHAFIIIVLPQPGSELELVG